MSRYAVGLLESILGAGRVLMKCGRQSLSKLIQLIQSEALQEGVDLVI